MQGKSTQIALRARAWRLWRIAGVALAVVGTAAIAAPLASLRHASAAFDVSPAVAPQPRPMIEKLVWEGADVDGDGQPDFANPTDQAPRATDAYGSGAFGASRDGGERRHEGVDFRADAGQPLAAPISGFVTKIGCAYPGDKALRFVEISNPALQYQARIFYIDPIVAVGQAVRLGQEIGTHHSLEQKYPGGMTDHVHLEILDTRGERVDPARLITAHMELVPAPARG